jgi:pilus assembly protein CpaF
MRRAAPAAAPVAVDKEVKRKQRMGDIKLDLHRVLLDNLNLAALEHATEADLRAEINAISAEHLNDNAIVLGREDRIILNKELYDEVTGLGPLETLLQDESVNDILVNGPQQIFVERSGKLELTDVTFKDERHLLRIIDKIVSAVGRRVDESKPYVDARLKDGSRFNAMVPPVAVDGSLVSIRKFKKDKLGIDDLVQFGAFSEEMAAYLQAAVSTRLNVIVSGGTGSGKTTTLNALSSFIADDERILTIEDTAELQLQQTHVGRMESRPPNVEGKGEVSPRDCLKNALRMRPDRIIVGETRGEEVIDMLQAMNTGHDGSMTTIHANNPRDGISRLENMVAMAGIEMPLKAVRSQISSAVNLIVQASRLQDGSRRMTSITEITGMEGDVISMQEIFRFQRVGPDARQQDHRPLSQPQACAATSPSASASGAMICPRPSLNPSQRSKPHGHQCRTHHLRSDLYRRAGARRRASIWRLFGRSISLNSRVNRRLEMIEKGDTPRGGAGQICARRCSSTRKSKGIPLYSLWLSEKAQKGRDCLLPATADHGDGRPFGSVLPWPDRRHRDRSTRAHRRLHRHGGRCCVYVGVHESQQAHGDHRRTAPRCGRADGALLARRSPVHQRHHHREQRNPRPACLRIRCDRG